MAERTIDWGMLGERLLVARRRRQLTSEALAKMAGTTRVTISKLEHGNKPHVSFDVIIRVADALGVSLDFLVGRKAEDEELLPAMAS
jgi:transcriptional regulator with XRE-family HTH domain